MLHKTLEFAIPDMVRARGLRWLLERHLALCEAGQATAAKRVFYDTFDWRAHMKNIVLEGEFHGDGLTLKWRTLGGGKRTRSARLAAPARFVWDLPEGDMRDGLAPVLQMRALLPVATVRSNAEILDVLNGTNETVARLMFEEEPVVTGGEDGGVGHALRDRLRVLPVKGHKDDLKGVISVVTRQMGLAPADDLFTEAMSAAGLVPGGYSSKIKVSLVSGVSGTRADDATRTVLRDIFATLRANEEGTREDTDSEFLHDFRVAVRRTRSALKQMRSVFPREHVAHFRGEFRWLQQLTGPARDLDVYLLGFGDYQKQLPDAAPDNLESLRGFLERKKVQAYSELVQGLDSDRYASLVQDWETFLANPPEPEADDAPDAGSPVEEVAGKRIWNTYQRVARNGAAIDDTSPAEELHELRKDCKELRYLLEFFQSLFPEDQTAPMVKSLKKLQDNLGEFQDCQVQSENLRQFGREMMEEREASADTLMTMGMLVDNLADAQARAREQFYKRFAAFNSDQNRKLFKRQFKQLKGVAAK